MALLNYANTTSNVWQFGIDVTVKNNDPAYAESTVTIQPMLRYVGGKASETRYQHRWSIHFIRDGVWLGGIDYHGQGGSKHKLLPNDTAEADVVGAGHLHMTQWQWYKWGDSSTLTIKNDGKQHTVGALMRCLDTQPTDCPGRNAAGAEVYLCGTIDLARYTVIPEAPTQIAHYWDASTKTIVYGWAPSKTHVSYVKVSRTCYNSAWNILKTGFLSVDGKDKFYDVDSANGTVKEKLPDNVAYVAYDIINYSVTGDSTKTSSGNKPLESTNKVWIKVGGQWKKAIPWVKVGNEWKKATKVYVKVGSEWKQTKS